MTYYPEAPEIFDGQLYRKAKVSVVNTNIVHDDAWVRMCDFEQTKGFYRPCQQAMAEGYFNGQPHYKLNATANILSPYSEQDIHAMLSKIPPEQWDTPITTGYQLVLIRIASTIKNAPDADLLYTNYREAAIFVQKLAKNGTVLKVRSDWELRAYSSEYGGQSEMYSYTVNLTDKDGWSFEATSWNHATAIYGALALYATERK
jgi:hypothetical protein